MKVRRFICFFSSFSPSNRFLRKASRVFFGFVNILLPIGVIGSDEGIAEIPYVHRKYHLHVSYDFVLPITSSVSAKNTSEVSFSFEVLTRFISSS